MSSRLSANKDLRVAAIDFFTASERAVCSTSEEIRAAMHKMATGENASRMVNGLVFDVDDKLRDDSFKIVRQIVKILGPKVSDEHGILTSLWNSAARRLIDEPRTPDTAARVFLDDIEQGSQTTRRYIHRNYSIIREPGVDRLSIGPVKIVDGSLVAEELNANRAPDRWLAEVRDPGIEKQSNGPISIGIPQNCWLITVNAARENLPEEAAWLAGIATSLLRITARPSLGPLVGNLGVVEPHPFKAKVTRSDGITADQDSVSTGDQSLIGSYMISPSTATYCGCPEFKTITEHLFTPAKGSLAERVSQGLGWLARGRQNDDRAERFLFFFTALEALLSHDDKTAPVVQTIARHTASILTDNHGDRAKNAKMVKDLYASRSALVHRGARSVSKSDANTVEHIAHHLFWRVLDQCDLAQKSDDFQKHLSDCSYGTAWANEDIHRLGPTPDWPARSAPPST